VNPKALRPLVAEFVGTLLFVFLGVGSVVVNAASNNALGALGTALVHGVGMSVLVTMTMAISGGHLNPAVSVSLWLTQKIDGRTLGQYVLAQILGAVVGALLVKGLFPTMAARVTSLGTPQLSGTLGLFEGIAIEALLTFFLVSAVFGTAVSPLAPKIAGFGIGLSIFTCALVGGSLTGGVMNPARAFGPALVSLDWHGQVVYWIGPAIGAAVAAVLWKYVLLPRDATDLA
jgi:aquaporin Z